MSAARYAVIGSPIAHSLSPLMQQEAFDAAGIVARYEAIEAPPSRLAETMQRLRANSYAGWNVTTPLKEAAVPFADAVSDAVRRCGAANTFVRTADGSLRAHNTDGAGLVNALADVWKLQPRGLSVAILGAGPAARAIAVALQDAGAATIACWSRSAQRAALIGPPPQGVVDLIVAALPAGAVIVDELARHAGADTDVFDVNYGTARSPVAALQARRRSNGVPLLLHQGALAFEYWTGTKAPLDAMRAVLAPYAL